LLGACADLGQVLDHDDAARSSTRNDLFGEEVVAILPKPSPPTRQLISPGRARLSVAASIRLLPVPQTSQQDATGRPGGAYTISNQDVYSAMFRIQRNFLY
jgi:hypothetical protein